MRWLSYASACRKGARRVPLAQGICAFSVLSLLVLGGTTAAIGQPSSDEPAVPARAASVAAMVPAGWTIEQQLHADLNDDGKRDALVLLRRTPSTGVEAGAPVRAADAEKGHSPQRAIVVLVGVRGGYALSALNARIVPQVVLGTQEDPLADGELSVRRGGFDLRLSLFSGVGSYQSAVVRYRFRYGQRCFRLVTYDRLETHRATLDTQDISVDFLAGTVVRKNGNAKSSAALVQREHLTDRQRRCLQDLGSAADYRP